MKWKFIKVVYNWNVSDYYYTEDWLSWAFLIWISSWAIEYEKNKLWENKEEYTCITKENKVNVNESQVLYWYEIKPELLIKAH